MGKMNTQIRLDERTYELVKFIAEKELRSLNAQMEYFILQGIRGYEKEHGEIGTIYKDLD